MPSFYKIIFKIEFILFWKLTFTNCKMSWASFPVIWQLSYPSIFSGQQHGHTKIY